MLSPLPRLASALLAACGSAAMLLASSGCANNKTPDYIPFPTLQNVGLRQVWERQVITAPKEHIDHVWRVADSVYVTTNQSRVIRIEAASGVKAWDITVGSNASEFHKPAEMAGGKDVVIANHGEVVVVNKATGRTEAMTALNFLATTNPIVSANLLCIGGNDDFYGLFLDQLGGRVWVTVAPRDSFTAEPAVIGDSLVLASTAGKLWRINAADGDWVWKDRKTNGEVIAGLATDNKAVYIPSLDHYLYAFDASTGSQMWDSRLEGTLDQKPLVAKGRVLVPSTGKGLYAVSTADGSITWEVDGLAQMAAVVGDNLWVGDTAGNLKEVALSDGSVISSTHIPAARAFVRSPDDWVIILNQSGVIEGYKAEK